MHAHLALFFLLGLTAASPFARAARLQESKELGDLAATRFGDPKIDDAFQKKLAAVLEEKMGLSGCKERGVGPLLVASLGLPGGKSLAFVFGYAKGKEQGKNKRWFIAFSSSNKALTPIEVPVDGELPAFQSISPGGIFWIVLAPEKNFKGQLLFFSAETEMEIKDILSSNGAPGLETTNYIQYPQKDMSEVMIYRVPMKHAKAQPGVFSVDPGKVIVNDLFIDTILQNFDKLGKSFTRIKPVNYQGK